MKYKFFQKSCIFLALLFCLSGCELGWERYDNEDKKFSILLPSSWEKEENALNTAVIALAPLKGKSASAYIRANINVIVVELSEAPDLATIFDLNRVELASKLATMDEASEGEIYAGTLRGKWLSFEGILHELKVKITSAIWVKGKYTYTVTCTSSTGESPKYDPIFKKIMHSLRVK
jgi:hypothetical protein